LLTDSQIDALSARFAARVTAGVAAIVGTHETHAHEDDEDYFSTPFAWQGHHAIEIREAVRELIRGLTGPVQTRGGRPS
jgi:hypothetical protein